MYIRIGSNTLVVNKFTIPYSYSKTTYWSKGVELANALVLGFNTFSKPASSCKNTWLKTEKFVFEELQHTVCNILS